MRPWQHVLEPLAGYLCLGQRLLHDPQAAAEAWNFGPPADAHRQVQQVIEAFAQAWPAVRYAIDGAAHPHEAAQLHLDCSKAEQRLRLARGVGPADHLAAQRRAGTAGSTSRARVASHDDLQQYVADARQRGLAWAA